MAIEQAPGAAAAGNPMLRVPALGMRTDQYEYIELIVMAVVVGILAACGNLFFRASIEFASWLFRTVEWRALGIDHGWHRALIPLVLLSGGAFILLLNRLFPGDVLGYGFPSFLEMVNLGNARIRRRWIFVKAAGAALSLGSGAAVGREGPIAQIGGAIGSAVAQVRQLSADRAKVLVAAGAGAGIATTFNAPIGGLMFALEIVLLNQIEIANLVLVLISTFSAVVTSRTLTGNASLFHPAPFVVRSYWEMLTYGLMGAGLGALAAVYIRFFHATGEFIRKLPIPGWARLAAGLAAVGVIAIALPQNLGDGYPVINLALVGKLGVGLMFALGVAKFVASSISLQAGAPGGVFGPTFFIGTMMGGAFRGLCTIVMPGLTGPLGSYALVGMGGFLAGVTHAPLTALFLLFEMTQLNPDIALPAMLTTITALIVARAIESESIDTYMLAREGKTLAIGRERLVLTQLPVASVMAKDAVTVRANATLAEVLRIAGNTSQATLPVVDNEGVLAGLIVTHDLLALLAAGDNLGPLVNAYDLSRQNPPVVTPESSLDQAAQLMEYDALDELPVVDKPNGGHFLGLVTRPSIAQAFNRVTVSLSTLDTRDQNIFWATGYRVSRLTVPTTSQGRTLRELDPRARFGVSVLAIQSGDVSGAGFQPVAPDRKLNAGDLLVAAGRPGDLRRFSRELQFGG